MNNDSSTEPSVEDRPKKVRAGIPAHPLPHNQLWTNNKINLKTLKSHLQREGHLLKEDAIYLVSTAKEIFRKEPNLLLLNDPITVCGDIHGQFFDLLRLMVSAGEPSETQYLFLGDYVDRGCFSMECVLWLYAHKITFPNTFWMIRGNHECRHLTSYFNFKDECIYKYDEELYDAIMDSFDCLPIAGTINGKFLACHGGLSPDIGHLEDIFTIDRFQEIPTHGPFCDIVWADPRAEEDQVGEVSDNSPALTWFSFNQTRQCSYYFGVDAVQTFLETNNLTSIIRAHEACFEGYKFQFLNADQVPRVITIFSAPNYCDVYKNKAACIKFENDLLNIRQYTSSPHPYYLPNFMDVITWSIPFLAEKACNMLDNVLSYAAQETNMDVPLSEDIIRTLNKHKLRQQKIRKRIILGEKIKAISRMVRTYRVIQEENENIGKLKALSPSGKLPLGILGEGSSAIAKALSEFHRAQDADKENMELPGCSKHSLISPKTFHT